MASERSEAQIRAEVGAAGERLEVRAALEGLGRQGSRFRLPTPALVVDLDRFDRNVARMAARAKAAGVALRPHAKSHKCAALAARQIAAGAVGVCCAKLGEAEALAERGVRGLLVTSPVVGAVSAARAARLARLDPGFAVVVDHPDAPEELAREAEAAGIRLPVFVDVDVGLGRTGVADAAAAGALARAVAERGSLRFAGVQAYGGQWQHMKGRAARAEAVGAGMTRLRDALAAIRAEGLEPDVVTGGGTGSFDADTEAGVYTERQVGSYALMDVQYADALGEDPDGAFEHSLLVQAQVVSVNAPGWVTLDAGLKAFATDGPAPRPDGRGFEGWRYGFFGDEHGRLTPPPGAAAPRRGDRIELRAPHCDPTVDRYDLIWLVRGDALVDVVRVDARGRGQ